MINELSKPSNLCSDHNYVKTYVVIRGTKKSSIEIDERININLADSDLNGRTARQNIGIDSSDESTEEGSHQFSQTISDENESVNECSKKYWGRGFQCDWTDCDYVASTRNKLTYHKNKHIGIKPFKCAVIGCDKAFHSEINMKRHVTFVHEMQKSIGCDWPQCNAMFKSRSNLKTHMRLHTIPANEKPFACDFAGCTYAAFTKGCLKLHKLVHTDHKPFMCAHCGRTYKCESTMKAHQLVHSQRSFKCEWPDCQMSYRCRASLRRHVMRHKNIAEMLYDCDWPGCEYKSKYQSAIYRHKDSHNPESNYPCSWPSCDRKLKSKYGLREHLMMHKNDKRHKCQWPGCEYRCVLAGNLKKHFNTHRRKNN